jgi:hypothetical protein
MNIFYQGTDITDMVQTRKCVVRDGSGKRCDSLELEFENAAGWYSWGPAEDDQIYVTHNGYESGIMYVNTILPEDGKYRILATSLPCKARNKANKSFINKTIEEIMRACAMSSGMDYQLFGIEADTVIPYIERENEGCAAFLQRLLLLEGAILKCVNGKYTAIGIQYAQGQTAAQTLYLDSQQTGTQYRRNGSKYKALIVRSPYARATATDTSISGTHATLVMDMPVLNEVQAGRWARSQLLQMNRQCESVTVQNEFNPGFTAMVRADIDGDTDATGEWTIEEAEHDFVNLTSVAKLYRNISTIE